MNTSILITICCRGGSKSIPGKNIRPLNGRPLISYSIDFAQTFAQGQPADVALSTDDDQIKNVAAVHGLSSKYVRPKSLATDSAGKIDAIADLLVFEEKSRMKDYEFVIDLDVTSPLRTQDDLVKAYEQMQNDKSALNLFSVSHAHRNPYFNMVEQKSDGYYRLVKEGNYLTRQTAPKVYDLNASFYIYRRAFFDLGIKSPITDRSLVYVMPHPCFDLDQPIDFDVMEYLLMSNKSVLKV